MTNQTPTQTSLFKLATALVALRAGARAFVIVTLLAASSVG